MTRDEEINYRRALYVATEVARDTAQAHPREAYLRLKARHHELTAIPRDARSGYSNAMIRKCYDAMLVLKPHAPPKSRELVSEYLAGVRQREHLDDDVTLTRRDAAKLAAQRLASLEAIPKATEKSADVRNRCYYRKAVEVLTENEYTVEVIGSEKEDGEKGTVFAVRADTLMDAIEKACDLYCEGRFTYDEHPFHEVLSAVPGVPAADCGYQWNDEREKPWSTT